MDLEIAYTLDNEQQFWNELDGIVSTAGQSHEIIDDALRSFLAFAVYHKDEFLPREIDVVRSVCRLIESPLFAAHPEYVRRQIVHCFLQEDASSAVHILATFLICDGRQNDAVLEMMSQEGCLSRLIELIGEKRDGDADGLHRLLLVLFYEMARIQQLDANDLFMIHDDFVRYLFQIIEGLSDDVNDPYHYPVIRVLLILNEQYMVSAHQSVSNHTCPGVSVSNKVIKILATDGGAYKSFGQNIILLLNREDDTTLQLLILKLLYLLFTSPATYEYFYTNDLHVLLDIMLRNLLDLSSSLGALQHTYLRVLYPLLEHTQLNQPPHYKHDEIQRLLYLLDRNTPGHFGTLDETSQRLVERCRQVSWLIPK